MIKIQEGTVKVSKDHQGFLVSIGIKEADRKYTCIGLEDISPNGPVSKKVHALMTEALGNLVDQFCELAEKNGLSADFQREGMLNNIRSFNLLAGSGFSDARKAQIIDEKYDDLVAMDVEPSVELFVAPKEGAVKVAKASVIGGLEL